MSGRAGAKGPHHANGRAATSPVAQQNSYSIERDHGDRSVAWEKGRLVTVATNRNSAGPGSMAFYLVGLVSFAVGIYLSTITQINLLTGQTSFPYLGVGIPLVVAGIVVVGLARRTAKRNLSR